MDERVVNGKTKKYIGYTAYGSHNACNKYLNFYLAFTVPVILIQFHLYSICMTFKMTKTEFCKKKSM